MKSILRIFILISFFTACGKEPPVVIQSGEKACQYCQMKIVDHFDSIECLLAYHQEHYSNEQHDKRSKLYVKNFFNKDQYIKAEQAFYMQSERLSSPMGANLSAYTDEASLERAKEKYKGKTLDLKQAYKYISDVWLKSY